MLASIKHGRLTAEEKAEIERLAATMRKPTPSRIARRLNRHPSTVGWYMITRGLIERRVRYRTRAGRRSDGTPINPFTPDQDRRLLELRTQGKVYREIAEVLSAEFGVPRSTHSVQVRNVMLAAYEEA